MGLSCIDQLNAFYALSNGVLSLSEQGLYLRLLMIWNSLMRPEWFEVANSQLMRETAVKSKMTIIAIRKKLQEKKFIQCYDPGHRSKTKYHLNDLTTMGTKNVPLGYKNCTLGYKNYTHNVLDGYKNCTLHRDISTTTTTTVGEVDKESQAVEFYQNNIRPICSGYELERLEDDISHYGEDTVIKAIKRAVTRNKRSIGYIEGILRRWETDGYDEEGEHGRRTRSHAGTHQRKAPRKDCTDWDDPNADFGGW